jgi:hypothetical protein
VPAAGAISATGGSVRRTGVRAGKAGTYTVTVRLTGKARRTLRKRGRVRTSVRVAFAPASGAGSSATVALTFKRKGR